MGGENLLDYSSAGYRGERNELREDIFHARRHPQSGYESSQRHGDGHRCESSSSVCYRVLACVYLTDERPVTIWREGLPVPISAGVISIDLFALLKFTYPSIAATQDDRFKVGRRRGGLTATFKV